VDPSRLSNFFFPDYFLSFPSEVSFAFRKVDFMPGLQRMGSLSLSPRLGGQLSFSPLSPLPVLQRKTPFDLAPTHVRQIKVTV